MGAATGFDSVALHTAEPAHSKAPDRRTLPPWASVAAATIVAAAILVAIAAQAPWWYDEELTRARALDLGAVYEGNAYGYFVLMHLWQHLVGVGYLVLRLPSVVAATAAVPLLWVGASRLYGRRVADVAVWALALHPMVMLHGSEARGYPFVIAAAAASLILLERAWRTDRIRDWVMFGLLVGAGLWFHLSAVWILPVAAMRARSLRMAAGWAVAGLTAVPVGMMVLASPVGGRLLAWTVEQYPLGFIVSRSALWTFGLLASPFVLLLFARGTDRVLAVWVMVPLVAMSVVTAAGYPSLWPRAMVATLPAVAIGVGRGFRRAPGGFRVTTLVVVACLSALHVMVHVQSRPWML